MSGLINGQWQNTNIAEEETDNGSFKRQETKFRDKSLIPESGRYHLFVSYLCPWASRTLIFRQLKQLEDIITVSIAKPIMGDNGWHYDPPVKVAGIDHEINYLYQVYQASNSTYTGKVSVPVLWDKLEKRIVNNESSEIIRLFNTEFNELTGNKDDYYPQSLRKTIDEWNNLIYANLNNGVYRAGFARTQQSYETAAYDVFNCLEKLETHLSSHRYIAGEYLTEADWRLFVTLIRLEVAYAGAFKCNLKSLQEYPHLLDYTRELYQYRNIKETVNLTDIKLGYYSNKTINPFEIIPIGPLVDYNLPHSRNKLTSKGVLTR